MASATSSDPVRSAGRARSTVSGSAASSTLPAGATASVKTIQPVVQSVSSAQLTLSALAQTLTGIAPGDRFVAGQGQGADERIGLFGSAVVLQEVPEAGDGQRGHEADDGQGEQQFHRREAAGADQAGGIRR